MDTRSLSCAVCKHSWETRGDDPARCPNPKCRSTLWRNGQRSARPRFTVFVTNDQVGQFERASKVSGKTVSDWLRDLGAEAVAPPRTTTLPTVAELSGSDRDFTGNLSTDEYVRRNRMTAAELAASIPGVRLGVVIEDGKEYIPIVVGDAPVEDVRTKAWLPELIRLQRMGELDPGSAQDEFQTLLRGEAFRPPKRWMNWALAQRAAYLDEVRPLIVE